MSTSGVGILVVRIFFDFTNVGVFLRFAFFEAYEENKKRCERLVQAEKRQK